jgi:hypothetical protein
MYFDFRKNDVLFYLYTSGMWSNLPLNRSDGQIPVPIMDDTQLDKLLERMPYADGSGRRRLVTGGIVLVGIAIILFKADALANFGDVEVDLMTVLGSPTLLLIVILAVYATGSIVEMLGDYFLVRAASGAFMALGLPGSRASAEQSSAARAAFYILYFSIVPLVTLWQVLSGLLGKTRYSIDLASRLTPEAAATFEGFPSKVVNGLQYPVGDDSEYALRHITETLTEEADRKWGRRLLNRVKDVSAVTTSLFLLGIIALLTSALDESSQHGGKISKPAYERLTSSSEMKAWNDLFLQVGATAHKAEAMKTAQGQKNRTYEEVLEQVWREADRYIREEDILDAITHQKTTVFTREEITREEILREEILREEIAREEFLSNWKNDMKYLQSSSLEYSLYGYSIKSNAKKFHQVSTDLIVHIYTLMKNKEERRIAVTAGVGVAFLLMYVGYFTGLRNAVTSIVERITIQMQESADTSQPADASGSEGREPPANFLLRDLCATFLWLFFGYFIAYFISSLLNPDEFTLFMIWLFPFSSGLVLSIWRWNLYRRSKAQLTGEGKEAAALAE